MSTEPIAWYWTLRGPDGRSCSCDLVRTDSGLEVRCREGDVRQRWERVTSEADGLNLAAAWKALYEAKGWVPGDDNAIG